MCQQIPLWERLADGVNDRPLVEERHTRPVADTFSVALSYVFF